MNAYTPRQLHDRATRGEQLTDEQQTILAEWYADQDRAESRTLRSAATSLPAADVRAQIDVAVRQLSVVSQRIEETMRADGGRRDAPE